MAKNRASNTTKSQPGAFKAAARMIRMLLGFAVAPLASAILLAIFPLVQGHYWEIPWGLTFAATVGYPVALLVGVPIFFILRWRRWVSLWHYMAVGVLFGAALFLFLYAIPQFDHWDVIPAASFIIWFCLPVFCATLATTSFWLIVRPN